MSTDYSQNTTYNPSPLGAGSVGVNTMRAVAEQNLREAISEANSKNSNSSGIPANLESLSTIASNNVPVDSSPVLPADKPLAAQFPGNTENLNQYRKQSGLTLATDTNQPWYTPETPTTKIANMPNFLGGGEYLTDPNSSNVANSRDYIPAENQAILGNRDPRLYQIDHIIPLWAGGADTLANKQILTLDEHHQKSMAQAVPFTLMAQGLITPQEAKVMALNWKNEDITGIPEAGASGGFIDTKIAQQKATEWQQVRPVTWSDWLKAIPVALKNISAPLSAKSTDDDATQFMKSLAGGFLSEASFGVIPYQQQSQDISANIGGFLGKIGGTVASFATFDGLLGMAGEAASKLPFLKSFANSAEVGGDIMEGAQATKEGATVGQVAGDIGKTIPVAVGGTGAGEIANGVNGINKIVKNIKIANVLKSAGLMTAFGQIRQTLPGAFGEGNYSNTKGYTMGTWGDHIKQAITDMAYGGIMGGAGHTVPGYFGVGAGAFTVSLMSGDNAQNSVLNAATMMALHGLGQSDANMKDKLPTLEDAMNKVADQTAKEHVVNRLVTGNPDIKNMSNQDVSNMIGVDNISKLTPDSAITLRAQLNNSRAQMLSENSNLDLTDIEKIRVQDEIALRQLEKGGMTSAVRKGADVQDIQSVGDKMRTKEQMQDTSVPDEIVQTVKNGEDYLFNNNALPVTSGENNVITARPMGGFPLTGLASNVDGGLSRDRIDYFFKKMGSDQSASNILLIERSELEPFFTDLNQKNSLLKAKEIQNNEYSLMKHPENSVQAFGVVKADPNSQPLSGVVRIKGSSEPLDIVPLGWVARQDRIASVDEGGRLHSFNQNALDMGLVDSPVARWLLDPKKNKDTLALAMKEQKIKVLSASLDSHSTPRTQHAGEPFLLTNISPDHWTNSAELEKQRINQTLGDNMSSLVTKAVKTQDPQAIVNVIDRIKQRNPNTGAAKIMKNIATTNQDPDTAFASDVLGTFEKGLNSGSVTQLQKDVNTKYGQVLDNHTAVQLMAHKKDFTVENAFDIIHDSIQNGTANTPTAILYRNSLIPLFEKINTQNITVDGIPINSFYLKMPVLANGDVAGEPVPGVKQVNNTQVSAPIESAPTNVIAQPGEVNTQAVNNVKPTSNNLVLPEEITEANPQENTEETTPVEKSYEKINTFNTPQKAQELELVKKEGTGILDELSLQGHESDANLFNDYKGKINNLINTYQWTNAEKQQAKDMLMSYAQFVTDQRHIPTTEEGENGPGTGVATLPGTEGQYGSSAAPDIEDLKVAPNAGNISKLDVSKTTPFKSIYPDIYNANERTGGLGQQIASRLNVEQLTQRASNTNVNTFANQLQDSVNQSINKNQPKVALLWQDVLDQFDKLGKGSNWRNKELDSKKFNDNMAKLSNDTVTSGPRAGSLKTVNPDIANYEMDINVGRKENLPTPLKEKYEELEKDGYGHVYSSPTMNTNAYKGKTPDTSSYNMFKFVKEYVDTQSDQTIVKQIYGDDETKAKQALQVLKTWRLGSSLTQDRLSSLEEQMYGKNKPGIAQAIENKKIDLNKGVSPEMIEAGLSPISEEDLKENPQFNNPLSHAIMSLAKYNINDLTPEEIEKLSKSVSFTLWPAVKKSLTDTNKMPKDFLKKPLDNESKGGKGGPGPKDGQGGPGDSLGQALFSGASNFDQKTQIGLNKSGAISESTPPFYNNSYNNTVPETRSLSSLSPVNNSLSLNSPKLGKVLSMAESSGGTNTVNKNADQGPYGYLVGFTKGTYNTIKQAANKGDSRYKELLNNLDFSSPNSAIQSGVKYFNFRNTKFDKTGNAVGTHYTNPEDVYVNLYNGNSGKNKTAALKNWRNVVESINNSLTD